MKRKNQQQNEKKKKTKKTTKEFIEIPTATNQSDSEDHLDLIDQQLDLNQEAFDFLDQLDQTQIARSSKQLKLENRKNRPKQTSSTTSRSYKLLPKISNPEEPEEGEENLDELDEDDFAFGSGGDDDLDLLSDITNSDSNHSMSSGSDFDDDSDQLDDNDDDQDYLTDDSALEDAYYSKRIQRAPSEISDTQQETELKLPIRHPDGTIQRFPKPLPPESSRAIKTKNPTHPEPQDNQTSKQSRPNKLSDPSHGPRFGRQALSEILSAELSLKARIQAAKLEIAGLAQEAIADPEMSLGSIKRIFAMTCPMFDQPHEKPENRKIKIDPPIRMMAILSLLAIFLDIIPGYRIRPITEAEKATKVTQMVARQREWEEGLVGIYRRYLEVCEKEVVSNNSCLSTCCLRALCKCLESKTHFNFSHNIMQIIVRKLGQREWDELSEECVQTIVKVFEKDIKGDDSLQLVRLIVRTIKSKNYSVHPELLSVLLSLRLKSELSHSIRASTERVYSSKDPSNLDRQTGKLPWKHRVAQPNKARPMIISKKARKIMKAKAGIEKEIAEAEESVKVEEKERNQTETLKMIFGCYFRIIKLPYRSILLPVALEGLSRFAHLVNIDFFKDLLQVLKNHIDGKAFNEQDEHQDEEGLEQRKYQPCEYRDRLECIVTAFELLSGQGQALNLDLTDIIDSFYGLLLETSVQVKLEEDERKRGHGWEGCVEKEAGSKKDPSGRGRRRTTGEVIVEILELIFFNQREPPAPSRALKFSKRLLTISLSCTESTLVLKLAKFLARLVVRQPVVKSLLCIHRQARSDDDDAEGDQPAWELFLLNQHWDQRVRTAFLNLSKL